MLLNHAFCFLFACQYSSEYSISVYNVNLTGVGLVDLCCFWMGGNSLPVGLTNENIVVKFDGGAKELPMSETCFLSIILPTQHKEYQTFKNKMDVALKYGSKGFSFS